MFNVALEVF